MLKTGLIGLGYWGKNLARALSGAPGVELRAVADANPAALDKLRATYPTVRAYDAATAMIADPEIDAVVIATPVASHYDLACAAIEHGKHVMIEKPMCRSSAEAADLVARAERRGLTVMVDHTFLFHPVVRELGQLVRSGSLGRISYYDSQRINLGLFQPDVNVIWDLAPHDLSILDRLIGEEPIGVEANGYCHVNPGSPDIGYITLFYRRNVIAHLNLSWMSPVKLRRVAVGGSAKMAVWDDLNRDEPLKIYDSGISVLSPSERDIVLPTYRVGSVTSPRLPMEEPLGRAIDHFRNVILGVERSISGGEQGVRMMRTLERIQTALDGSLSRVQTLAHRPQQAIAAE